VFSKEKGESYIVCEILLSIGFSLIRREILGTGKCSVHSTRSSKEVKVTKHFGKEPNDQTTENELQVSQKVTFNNT